MTHVTHLCRDAQVIHGTVTGVCAVVAENTYHMNIRKNGGALVSRDDVRNETHDSLFRSKGGEKPQLLKRHS